MFARGSDGAPRPVFAARDQARLDGVVEDVLERVLVVGLVVDDPGGEALTEERAFPPEARVVLSGVVALEPLGRFREILDAAREDRMVVRAEQAVRVEAEAPAAGRSLQERQESMAILVVHEQQRLVDGVRGDVEVAVGQLGAAEARHAPNARF